MVATAASYAAFADESARYTTALSCDFVAARVQDYRRRNPSRMPGQNIQAQFMVQNTGRAAVVKADTQL